MDSDFSDDAGPLSSQARLVAAAVLAAGLAAVIGIVAFAGGDSDGATAGPADAECVQGWNEDPGALSFGRHQSLAHQYTRVQVTRLAPDGGPAADGEEGSCAVVFAAQALDPEPGAAAQILNRGKWGPVSSLPGGDAQRLGELQSGAQGAANASLGADGSLTAD